jgi:two-component system, chemotaxis family, protein-glutamate methylesterase/glutaminase
MSMRKIRVLVVDDAVVIRKILSDAISADPDLEVAGTAPNGKVAIQKIPQINPDVITLDIEMPEMDGLETLKHIRKDYPKLPIIMFSTLTGKGATATLDALANGASDYVTKPANVGSVTTSKETVQQDLIRKIKCLGGSSTANIARLPTMPSVPRARSPVSSITHPVRAVAIGVSTGGPNALAALIPRIPKNFPVPILIVQHMPAMFTKFLADRLAAQSGHRVVEATEGEEVLPGSIYIAPGDFHMDTVRKAGKTVIALHQGPQENSCRPAVDVLFRSAAQVYGKNLLGVVLTGMGSDGLRGCQNIKDAGGQVIVQDKASSVVWGMPGYVAEAGLADAVLPLDNIAQEIWQRVAANATSASQPGGLSKGLPT